jgi:glycosyltransferase 2 family protein
MNSSRFFRTALQNVAKFLISFILIAGLLLFVDSDSLIDALSTLTFQVFAYAVLLGTTVLVLNSLRWAIIVKAARFPHSFRNLILVRLVAQGLNAFLPGGVLGDGLQIFLITRKASVSAARALSTVFFDRMIALFVILTVLAFTIGDTLPEMLDTKTVVFALVACMAVISGGVYVLLKFQFQLTALKGWTGKIMVFGLRFAKEIRKAISNPGILIICASLSFVGHLISVAMLWYLVNVFAEVTFSFMIPLISMVVFVTLVPLTFLGIGLREAALFAGLKQFGFSLEEAVAVSLIWLSITLLTNGVLTGAVILMSSEPEAVKKFVDRVWRSTGKNNQR